ncbi:MAG: hypothetical protein HZC29_03835 [Thaumarchaeota archaeon]|nr:hypothetical protein [Nitrososphaerota archaeon]
MTTDVRKDEEVVKFNTPFFGERFYETILRELFQHTKVHEVRIQNLDLMDSEDEKPQ